MHGMIHRRHLSCVGMHRSDFFSPDTDTDAELIINYIPSTM